MKFHARSDTKGRRWSPTLTDRTAHHYPAAKPIAGRTKPARRLRGDKAYDLAELADGLPACGIKTVILNRSDRIQRFSFNEPAYRQWHNIGNASCRFEDFCTVSSATKTGRETWRGYARLRSSPP